MRVAAAGLTLLGLSVGILACHPAELPESPERVAALKENYRQLHRRLEAAAAADPLFVSAFKEKGEVVVAIRSGLVDELTSNITHRYLDTVKIDLDSVKGKGSGEIERRTFLGKIKVGEWNVEVSLGELVGDLTAGDPQMSLRPPNLIDVRLPVDVHETEGTARLHFSWDSNGIANVLCKDFELTRDLRGRVLKQRHTLTGSLQLDNTGEGLIATPLFPDRKVQLKLDLTPKSWDLVEEALRSQNTGGTCGTLMKPDRVLAFLKDLAARGIRVKLPDKIFRVVRFPGRLEEAVKVNGKRVPLGLKAESLRIENAALWSSASVQVRAAVPKTSPAP